MPYERKFRIKGIKSTNPMADIVDYELESSDTVTGTIHNIHEKKELYRKNQ
jgi:ribosome biogenesis GTPase